MDRTEIIATIKEKLPCASYLHKSKGGMYCCPVCGSGTGTHKTGALKVYDTNTWTCHACGKSGDVLDLLQITGGLDLNGAIAEGAAALGLPMDGASLKNADLRGERPASGNLSTTQENTARNADKSPTEAKPAADYTRYYERCRERLTDPAAVSYLTARGITTDTAAALGVGYDPAADPAGNPGAADKEHKAHPVPRLIIPTGPAHYVGRRVDGVKEYDKVNCKGGSPGIFNAAALDGPGSVFVVEGAFDAMSLAECGAAAVAINSTSNGKVLADVLRGKTTPPSIVICFDNDPDPATHKRTQQAAEGLKSALQAQKIPCRIFDIAGYTKDGEKDVNDILRRDKNEVMRMIEAAKQEGTKDYLAEFMDKVQGETYRPIETGLPFFDELLGGGMIRQTLLLLMAAPGTGKTTLCQQIAEAMAARRQPVLYLNFEMSREQMTAKAISGRLAKRDIHMTATQVLQGYNWTLDQRAAIVQEVGSYRETVAPFLQYLDISSDLDDVLQYLDETGARETAAGRQAPAVVVDYLHLISSRRGLENAELIKQSVIGLKEYAKKYGTFVIAIVATNRVSNTAGKITLESGRDSSNIEYTADYQLGLNYYDIDKGIVKTDNADGIADLQREKWRRMLLRVLKSRFGQPGKSAKVYFNAAGNYFLSVEGFTPDGAKSFDPPAEPAKKRI